MKSNVVKEKEFNSLMNNLIKLIENDYQPIRTSVSHMEKDHE